MSLKMTLPGRVSRIEMVDLTAHISVISASREDQPVITPAQVIASGDRLKDLLSSGRLVAGNTYVFYGQLEPTYTGYWTMSLDTDRGDDIHLFPSAVGS
jgi:hypothetical protein